MKYNNIKSWRLFRALPGIMLLFTSLNLFSQQDPVFNQYMNNLLTIQPAYAGMSGYVNVTALSRIQWVGFVMVPQLQIQLQFRARLRNITLDSDFP